MEKFYERSVYESVENRSLSLVIWLENRWKTEFMGKELFIECHLGVFYDLSRFLNLITITTQLKI